MAVKPMLDQPTWPTEWNRATNDPDRQSDESLVVEAQSDRAAFAPLYARYVDPIFRYCYRRLGERAAAEDATCRIFERALAGLPTYRHESFRAWLFTIARNVVTDAHRVRRDDQPLDTAHTLADGQPSPEDTAIAATEKTWIRDMLARLPDAQRQIVELRLAGLNDREIAQVLGRSHGSIRTAQYRALQRLRELSKAWVDEEEKRDASQRS